MKTQESTEMIVYRICEVISAANINILPPSFLREEKNSYNSALNSTLRWIHPTRWELNVYVMFTFSVFLFWCDLFYCPKCLESNYNILLLRKKRECLQSYMQMHSRPKANLIRRVTCVKIEETLWMMCSTQKCKILTKMAWLHLQTQVAEKGPGCLHLCFASDEAVENWNDFSWVTQHAVHRVKTGRELQGRKHPGRGSTSPWVIEETLYRPF